MGIINEFLDREYTPLETGLVLITLLGVGLFMGSIFGNSFQISLGLIFLSVGIYGYFRKRNQRKVKNETQ